MLPLCCAIVKCDYFKLSSSILPQGNIFRTFELYELYFISVKVHKLRTSQLWSQAVFRLPVNMDSRVRTVGGRPASNDLRGAFDSTDFDAVASSVVRSFVCLTGSDLSRRGSGNPRSRNNRFLPDTHTHTVLTIRAKTFLRYLFFNKSTNLNVKKVKGRHLYTATYMNMTSSGLQCEVAY